MLLATALAIGAPSTEALTLFGVDIANANRAQMRQMVKRSGAKLRREGGTRLFDEYDSERLLEGSHTLYLGFDRQTTEFAFLEYELLPYFSRKILAKLRRKYGEPQREPGTFLSDTAWRWQVDGIQISLYRDFRCFCSRLEYAHPARLQALRQFQAERDQALIERELDAQSNAF